MREIVKQKAVFFPSLIEAVGQCTGVLNEKPPIKSKKLKVVKVTSNHNAT